MTAHPTEPARSAREVYVIRYRYADPSPAGPFTGRLVLQDKAAKGDEIRAPFGRAVVTSCRRKVSP